MQVRIEMDQVWTWWLDVSDPTYEIPDALVSRYNKLREEMLQIQEVFEQLYRAQEGMRLHPTPKIDVEQYRIRKD